VGLLGREAQRLIEPFARHVVSGRPLVVAKVGMTLDGKIGLPGRGRLRVTSAGAAGFTQTLRHRLDAVLVGVGTILEDDPALTYRGLLPKGRPIVRAILDSNLRIPPSARLFADRQAPVVLFCGHGHSRTRRRLLEQAGAEIIPVRRGKSGLSLARVLEELGSRGILGILVEGGSTVHWSLVSGRLVDKFYFIVAPTVLGGVTGIPAVGGAGYAGLSKAPRFKLTRVFRSGGNLVIEAYPQFSRSFISPWLP
ncbi:MAG: RibD family protein, partial [Acidobacteria bacterium]|nr:RibD family protein [Acidobacteriota bacterium]